MTEDAEPDSVRVTFVTNDMKTVTAPGNRNLLWISVREKGGIPFKCGGGICGTCRCLIEVGRDLTDAVKPKERKHLTEADLAAGYRMACQTFVLGDISVSWVPREKPISVKGSSAMKRSLRLELDEARALADAALAEAARLGVAETVCVADEGGHPLLLVRMDGARLTGPRIAWDKAFTAAGHRRSTHLFNQPPNGPALPGNEAFGIQGSFDGRFTVFVGGFPIVVDGAVVGGLGLSGGNGEQDTACAMAALGALRDRLAGRHEVLVAADIKV